MRKGSQSVYDCNGFLVCCSIVHLCCGEFSAMESCWSRCFRRGSLAHPGAYSYFARIGHKPYRVRVVVRYRFHYLIGFNKRLHICEGLVMCCRPHKLSTPCQVGKWRGYGGVVWQKL